MTEHQNAICTSNMNYLMAKHYLKVQRGNDRTLKVPSIKDIGSMLKIGTKKKQTCQKKDRYIVSMLSKAPNTLV